jgi:hypothetical protein
MLEIVNKSHCLQPTDTTRESHENTLYSLFKGDYHMDLDTDDMLPITEKNAKRADALVSAESTHKMTYETCQQWTKMLIFGPQNLDY